MTTVTLTLATPLIQPALHAIPPKRRPRTESYVHAIWLLTSVLDETHICNGGL
jgi:hypothetical protein